MVTRRFDLQAQEIEEYLAQVGQVLEEMGLRWPIRVLMVGGAFMLTQVRNREQTDDVDVFLKDIDDWIFDPRSKNLRQAIHTVASRNSLDRKWMNNIIHDLLHIYGVVPEGTLWRSFGKLEIYIPELEYILALKLMAGRRKDLDDIRALLRILQIQTREQAQEFVDWYVPDRELQESYHLKSHLDRFFSPKRKKLR
jgi:predicted nucleotidyltransferase